VRLPAPAPRGRTVADVLVETLVAFGITHVFGMVGHSNLGFADAMRRAEERGQLTFTGIRHEGAASFAASAYGKLTGRPAACFAIAGPGSTNMLTGLYDAKLDQSPVLAISGQVPSKVLGRGAFQDLDLTGIFGDVAAWTAEVHADSDHAELAALAVKHALDARGVAHLVIPDTHPLGAGVLGRSGTPVASWLMNEADLLIVVGASFANHTGIAPYKPILQIDDNPTTPSARSARSSSLAASRSGTPRCTTRTGPPTPACAERPASRRAAVTSSRRP